MRAPTGNEQPLTRSRDITQRKRCHHFGGRRRSETPDSDVEAKPSKPLRYEVAIKWMHHKPLHPNWFAIWHTASIGEVLSGLLIYAMRRGRNEIRANQGGRTGASGDGILDTARRSKILRLKRRGEQKKKQKEPLTI